MRRKKVETLSGLDESPVKRVKRRGSRETEKAKRREVLDRKRRLKWWHEARYGMFVHYGLFSLLGRGESVMYWDRIPAKNYEKLARTFKPKHGAARGWAALAHKSGMKYVILTAKYDDGFCLWDTKQTKFNSVKMGPKRDIIREYVDACREFGLKVGVYYNLNEWYNPDAVKAAKSKHVRRRYLDFVQGCVRELMTNYGKIDILFYDFPAPLETPELWESAKMNAMVRKLQPDIVINNRSKLPEDYDTPEGVIGLSEPGRACESNMPLTQQGNWDCRWEPPRDWPDARKIIERVRQATEGGGNLVLNIGPLADGSVPDCMKTPLLEAGKWIKGNEEAIYGKVDRVEKHLQFHPWVPYGKWTLKGNVGYFWCRHWPGKELHIVETRNRVKRITFLKTGKPVKFDWKPGHLVLRGLPENNPDKLAYTTIFKIEFVGVPRRTPSTGLVWCARRDAQKGRRK